MFDLANVLQFAETVIAKFMRSTYQPKNQYFPKTFGYTSVAVVVKACGVGQLT